MSVANSTKALDEETRFAYLQAMGIDCWELKSEPQSNLKSESQATGEEKPETLAKEIFDRETLERENTEAEALTQVDKPVTNAAQEKESVKIVENNQTNNILQQYNTGSTAFLKLVSWTNQNLKEENAKTLLIICRHQIDQPANSFATPTAPSQFMLDYINALQSFIEEQSFGINIRLAHLSEAGLGKEAVPMDNILQNIQPDVALLLGDETISHLFDSQVSIASLRGQLVDLDLNYKAFVSYHPFSLIENPSIKSLALDDLINLADYLSSLE